MLREDEYEIAGKGIKIALIHAGIHWKNKEENLANLLALNENAAGAGARIILNTEMATTGYSFENRADIGPLTEIIPGPTTEAFGKIAERYGCYICIGLPETDPCTGIFYNATAVIGPMGKVAGKYRKTSPAFKENLWAAKGNLPVPVIQTEFGRFGVIICADSYSYKPARVAALRGASLLLVPANWPPENHNPEKLWRARAAENGIYVLACNRTGKDKTMDCRKAESFIIDPLGVVIKQISSLDDIIIYSTLPIQSGMQILPPAENILNRRRPRFYGNISLDTYSHLNTQMLLGLPENADLAVSTLQLQSTCQDHASNIEIMLKLIDKAAEMAIAMGTTLNLAVFPELATTGNVSGPQEAMKLCEVIPGLTTDILAQKAKEMNVFIVFGIAEKKDARFYNSSVLVGPGGVVGRYRKVHLSSWDNRWAWEGDVGFPAFDLPFGRVGMQIGCDLLFPEGSDSLAKIGTDLLCVPAFWVDSKSKFIWEARLAEQMHLAIANQWGDIGGLHALGGSLLCSYSRYPEKRKKSESPAEGDWIEIMQLGTKNSREKRFSENVEYNVLLNLSGKS
ncbi:MAG: carbon-nitrogen hydrolase family protein [Methanothrix sp.]|nr:carbon-nitrogen hydrolase family protein [Methanothrix sp.]